MAQRTAKQTTIYLDPQTHRALKHKAVEKNVSLSELVNQAVNRLLQGHDSDVGPGTDRVGEPPVPYGRVTVRIGEGGEFVIPQKLRKKLRIKKGMKVFIEERDGDFVVRPEEEDIITRTFGMFKGGGALKFLEEERRREAEHEEEEYREFFGPR